jgi:AmpD protein
VSDAEGRAADAGPRLAVAANGWITGIARRQSPNCDARPAEARVELIVIHNISLPPGCYGRGEVARLFTNSLDPRTDPFFDQIAAARVSAHLLIERDGRVTQFVSLADRAWHAGDSMFEGRPRCNDFSIGIELEGTDFEPFADTQYAALNAVLAAIFPAFPVRAVCGHSDIAAGRKTDPGPCFDWRRVTVPPRISLPASIV